MQIVPNKNLFWFLKDGVTFDLSKPADLETYVQQVFSRGREKDVRELLKRVEAPLLCEVFVKIKRFLPKDVARFWEDYFAGH